MDELLQTELAIRQLYARYVDAVWRKDVESFGICFATNAEWRLSGVVVQGRLAIIDCMTALLYKVQANTTDV